jgi:hypothetical protein
MTVFKNYFINIPIEPWMVCPICGRTSINYQSDENGRPLILNEVQDSVFVGCEMSTADKEIHGRYISMTDFVNLINPNKL